MVVFLMTKKERNGLKESIKENRVDFEREYGYKESILREQKIQKLENNESKKYGLFKLGFFEEENYYVNDRILLEKYISEILYFKNNDKWEEVLSHSIYSYEKELDHGKEYIYKNCPLIKYIYVDIEEEIFYIEDIDGGLYCSVDRIRWYTYLVPPKDRPYYQRVDKLRKIKIPNL